MLWEENPEILTVELTRECNNNCLFCYQKKKSKEKHDIARIKEKIVELRKRGTKYIEFSGGEPTLSRHLPDLITLANNEKYENISLLTNGRRLSYENYFSRLVACGLKTVIFMVPEVTSETYEKITLSGKGGFSQLRDALNLAKKKRKSIEFGTVTIINKNNYRHLPKIISWIAKMKPSFITLSYPIPLEGKGEKKIIPSISEIRPFIKKVSDRFGKKNKLCIDGIPWCQLPESEKCILNEMFQKECLILSPGGNLSKRLDHIKMLGMKKESCNGCRNYGRCVGFFIEYIDKYDYSESGLDCTQKKVALDIQSGSCDYDYIFCTRQIGGKRYHELERETASVDYEKLKIFFDTSSRISNQLDIWGREKADEFHEIHKVIGMAKKYFQDITLWTSGLKLSNEERIRKFLDEGVSRFEIPIYGANGGTHDFITKKKGSFTRVLSTLDILRKMDVEINLHVVILKENYRELPDIIKLSSGYSQAALSFWFYYPDPGIDHMGINVYKEHCASFTEIINCFSRRTDGIENVSFRLVFFPQCIFMKIKKILKKAELIEPGFVRFMVANGKKMEYKLLTGKGEFGAVFLKKCDSCSEKNRCSGIFDDYIKIYGENEIKPINK